MASCHAASSARCIDEAATGTGRALRGLDGLAAGEKPLAEAGGQGESALPLVSGHSVGDSISRRTRVGVPVREPPSEPPSVLPVEVYSMLGPQDADRASRTPPSDKEAISASWVAARLRPASVRVTLPASEAGADAAAGDGGGERAWEHNCGGDMRAGQTKGQRHSPPHGHLERMQQLQAAGLQLLQLAAFHCEPSARKGVV